jgi:Tol biopolymer transport system component
MNLNIQTKKIINFALFSTLLLGSLSACMKQVNPEEQGSKVKTVMIPYILKEKGQTDLYIMDQDGQYRTKLTDDVYEEADPSMLPNGKVIFSSKRTGTWQLYTINYNGTNLKPLTRDKGFNNYRPALSVDGSIIFVSDRRLKPRIYSMDVDASVVTELTSDDNYYDFPSPLDDGTILYLSNAVNKWEIWKMNADGTNKQKITNIPSKPISLTAMPSYVKDTLIRNPMLDDSFANKRSMALYNLPAKAVFTARDNKNDLEIYRINVDGSDLRNLSQMPGVDANPVVLKNGKIIFTSDRDGTFDVWIMDPDGFNPINLTKEPNYASTR